MTFKIGDRVRYKNSTGTGIPSAVGEVGTVVNVDTKNEYLTVVFDHPCWQWGKSNSGQVKGFWKWELADQGTPEHYRIIRKCQDLTQRFQNKQLKTKSKPLPFPKEVKYV